MTFSNGLTGMGWLASKPSVNEKQDVTLFDVSGQKDNNLSTILLLFYQVSWQIFVQVDSAHHWNGE